jgi:hypothetical protein
MFHKFDHGLCSFRLGNTYAYATSQPEVNTGQLVAERTRDVRRMQTDARWQVHSADIDELGGSRTMAPPTHLAGTSPLPSSSGGSRSH